MKKLLFVVLISISSTANASNGGIHVGDGFYQGPRGGCFRIVNGEKEYVDRSICKNLKK